MLRRPSHSIVMGAVACGVMLCTGWTHAGAEPVGDNPFGDFETRRLENGFTIWAQQREGQPNAFLYLTVGTPEDRELAHLVEHCMFHDREGQPWRELSNAIERKGGEKSAATMRNHTAYHLFIPNQHTGFAIEWLAEAVKPRTVAPDLVRKQAQTIILERSVPAPGPWNWLAQFERFESLDARIVRRVLGFSAAQVNDFIAAHYAPRGMTLIVISNLTVDDVTAAVAGAFGGFEDRPVPAPPSSAPEGFAGRERQFHWDQKAGYGRRIEFSLETPADHLRAIFFRRLLEQRVDEYVRLDDECPVYSFDVGLLINGSSRWLAFWAQSWPPLAEHASRLIEAQWERIQSGTLPASEFESDKSELLARLRRETQSTEGMARWIMDRNLDPYVFDDFPNVIGFFAEITQADLATFARDHIQSDLTMITRRDPLPPHGVWMLWVGLTLSTPLTSWVVLSHRRRRRRLPPINWNLHSKRARILVPVWLAAGIFVVPGMVRSLFAAVRQSTGGFDHYGLYLASQGTCVIVVTGLIFLILHWTFQCRSPETRATN